MKRRTKRRDKKPPPRPSIEFYCLEGGIYAVYYDSDADYFEAKVFLERLMGRRLAHSKEWEARIRAASDFYMVNREQMDAYIKFHTSRLGRGR